jgi:hypothetical protein
LAAMAGVRSGKIASHLEGDSAAEARAFVHFI